MPYNRPEFWAHKGTAPSRRGSVTAHQLRAGADFTPEQASSPTRLSTWEFFGGGRRKQWPLLSIACICFATLLAGCGEAPHQGRVSAAEPGKTQFDTHCAACHLSEGPGMMGEAPPLEGSPWVTGPEDRLIKIVLHGLHGPIEVRNKTYNQEMPGFGKTLSDSEIASLLSFVRKRFGESRTPVSPAIVSRVRDATRNRSGYWTVDELLKDQ